MNKLSRKEVLHIAKLANLSLTEEEIELFSKQLSETLRYVEELKTVEVKGINPVFQISGLNNVWREDEVKPSFSQEEALKNAKSTYKGFFKVKSIF